MTEPQWNHDTNATHQNLQHQNSHNWMLPPQKMGISFHRRCEFHKETIGWMEYTAQQIRATKLRIEYLNTWCRVQQNTTKCNKCTHWIVLRHIYMKCDVTDRIWKSKIWFCPVTRESADVRAYKPRADRGIHQRPLMYTYCGGRAGASKTPHPKIKSRRTSEDATMATKRINTSNQSLLSWWHLVLSWWHLVF